MALLSFGIALHAQPGDMDQFSWLPGTWTGNSGKGMIFESWYQFDDNTLLGQGGLVLGGDTVNREQLRIQKIGKYITYIPIPGNNLPVLFTLVASENNTWTFENTEHDFPQRIIYSHSYNELKAWIEGMENGKFKKVDFLMQKIE